MARVRPAFDPKFYGRVEDSPLPLPGSAGTSSAAQGDICDAPVISDRPDSKEALLSRARNLMRDNAGRPDFCLEDLAAALCLCKRQVQRTFKDASDKSFREELATIRMRLAAHKLQSGERGSIARVATEVGYTQPMHFAKAFRRHFGCSPREWRRRSTCEGATAGS